MQEVHILELKMIQQPCPCRDLNPCLLSLEISYLTITQAGLCTYVTADRMEKSATGK